MTAVIDEHRAPHGVEPICRVLPIARSTHHAHAARRDITRETEIRRVYEENFDVHSVRVYGVRKVWRQLCREGIAVARGTVARLMAAMGLQCVVRGKRIRTTISNAAAPGPPDRVKRQFTAPRPNALGVGFHRCRDLGRFCPCRLHHRRLGAAHCRLACLPHAGFVREALEQARRERRPMRGGGLVHHSSRGVPYLSSTSTERLAAAGIEPSGGSVGDSCDNALAKTVKASAKPR